MPKDIYRVTINIEREGFEPMTDEQWLRFSDKMDEESFDNPFADVVETAMEIEATLRENE